MMKYILLFSFLVLFTGSGSALALTKTSVKALPAQLEACNRAECVQRFKEYKILSRYGHSDAMYTFAEMYRIGYGTDIDMRLATKWYRRAAKLGNPFAEYKAAIIYLQDTPEQDIDKAMLYLREANRNGLSDATHLLGMLYLEGGLVEKDIEQAKAYFTKAYEAEFQPTINLLSEASEAALEVAVGALPQQEKASLVAPKGEMEVIEVRAPSLEEVFTYHISLMRNNVPDGGTGTGTLIRGRSCGEMIACNTEADRERIREFLMSTW